MEYTCRSHGWGPGAIQIPRDAGARKEGCIHFEDSLDQSGRFRAAGGDSELNKKQARSDLGLSQRPLRELSVPRPERAFYSRKMRIMCSIRSTWSFTICELFILRIALEAASERDECGLLEGVRPLPTVSMVFVAAYLYSNIFNAFMDKTNH